MRGRLSIIVVWTDESLLEVQVAAQSEEFSGKVNLYTGIHEILGLAETFAGFPAPGQLHADFAIGKIAADSYGEVAIRLTRLDGAGHCEATVKMLSGRGNRSSSESANVIFRILPSDIDRFTSALRSMRESVGEKAELSDEA